MVSMLTRIKHPSMLCMALLLLLSLGLLPAAASARPSVVHAAASATPAVARQKMQSLPQVVRMVEAMHFGEMQNKQGSLDEFAKSLAVNSRFRKRAGVFVTLSRDGKTRACWGSIYPQQQSIAEETVFATIGALTKEYRYRAIQASEWKQLKPQVTVIRSIDPISSLRGQNPVRDGLLVRTGGKGGVLLPGEATDAWYQLVQCKLKAGIKPGEPCQLFRLRTEIYE